MTKGSKASKLKQNKQFAFVKQIAPNGGEWKQTDTQKAIANEFSKSLTT
ncbi:hypothetical protein [Coprobacter fastidiosus]|jgi:hypothetical protein|nr:hypothetical protein [Coprobacter fastidiosus]